MSVIDSTDTSHECFDGEWVEDTDAETETNEHGDVWCADCGERILVRKRILKVTD